MTGIERLRKLTDATLGYVRVASVTPHDYEYENDVEWDERMHLSELLASIYSQINREQDAMVADSPYEALPPEDREAIAWVRDHGGLESMKEAWGSRVPYDKHERARQRLLDHIAECETALRRRNQRIEELGHRVSDLTAENADLRKRAMPDGMEWPMVDGEPVVIGERMRSCGIEDCKVVGIDPENAMLILASDEIEKGKAIYFPDFAVYCRRPAPKVLDADGAEIEVGDDLYSVEGSLKFHVSHVDRVNGKIATDAMFSLDKWADPSMYTHRAPVLAADGKPLREGETVWGTKGGSYHLTSVHDGKAFARHVGGSFGAEVESAGGEGLYRLRADQLTHKRPVADTWERLEEDAGKNPFDYCKDVGHRLDTCENSEAYKARDLVRRAKKLAERERGER